MSHLFHGVNNQNVYNEKEIVRLKTKTLKACIDISQHYNKVLHACVAGDPEFVSRRCVCVCVFVGGGCLWDNFVVQERNAPSLFSVI